jgi:hypothetical protein
MTTAIYTRIYRSTPYILNIPQELKLPQHRFYTLNLLASENIFGGTRHLFQKCDINTLSLYIYIYIYIHIYISHVYTLYIYIYIYNTFLETYQYYNPRLEQSTYTKLLASVQFLHETGSHILCVHNARRSF